MMEYTGASGCIKTSPPLVDSTRKCTHKLELSRFTIRQAFALQGAMHMDDGV